MTYSTVSEWPGTIPYDSMSVVSGLLIANCSQSRPICTGTTRNSPCWYVSPVAPIDHIESSAIFRDSPIGKGFPREPGVGSGVGVGEAVSVLVGVVIGVAVNVASASLEHEANPATTEVAMMAAKTALFRGEITIAS